MLRFLKTKEGAIEDVVSEYRRNGAQIIERLESQHAKERSKVLEEQQERSHQFLASCLKADHATGKLSDHLRDIKVDEKAFVGPDPANSPLMDLRDRYEVSSPKK